MSKPPPAECANCGTTLPRGARACPECGADERTGWRDTSIYDGLDLPEKAFEEDGSSNKPPPVKRVNGIAWYWWVVAVGLLILAACGFTISL
jgi:hypothetical protein